MIESRKRHSNGIPQIQPATGKVDRISVRTDQLTSRNAFKKEDFLSSACTGFIILFKNDGEGGTAQREALRGDIVYNTVNI